MHARPRRRYLLQLRRQLQSCFSIGSSLFLCERPRALSSDLIDKCFETPFEYFGPTLVVLLAHLRCVDLEPFPTGMNKLHFRAFRNRAEGDVDALRFVLAAMSLP